MRNLTIFILSFLLFATVAYSGQSTDPLPGLPKSGGQTEMFLLWGEGANQNSMQSHQKIYKYLDSVSLPVGQRIFGADSHIDTGSNRGVGGNQQMVVATGHFNADRYEDVVAAWAAPNDRINLLIPGINPSSLSWNSSEQFSTSDSVLRGGGTGSRRIYLATGNFDSDPEDEFVLAFHGADSTIHINLYDTDSTFTPRLKASIHDEHLSALPDGFARYSLTVGDFDGDGKDEIALAFFDPNAGGHGVWGIVLKIYSIAGVLDDELLPVAREVIFTNPGSSVAGINLALVSGKFTSDSVSTLVFAITMNTGISVKDTYLYAVRVSKDLGTITVNTAGGFSGDFNNENEMGALSLAAGDLNLDGRDEAVLALDGAFYLYDIDDSFNILAKGHGPTPFVGSDDDRLTYSYVAVGDFDHDFRRDIIVANDTYGNDPTPQGFEIFLFSVDSMLQNLTLKGSMSGGQTATDNGPGSWRHYAIATGDFGGNMLRVGVPYHYVRTNIVEPIVILNAPPVHFDVFDTTKYDISSCYDGRTCDFTASYDKVTTNSVEVEINVHSDWSFTAGDGLSGSLGEGATVNYSEFMQDKWGGGFSKDSTASQTITIGVAVKAIEDDQIYATISDYDVWEYPIYLGTTDTVGGAIVVMSPSNVQTGWFPSKSWSAASYVPDHEVGQILSYQAYDTLGQNPEMDEQIRASYLSDSYTLGSNTSYDWDLTRNDFRTTVTDSSHSFNTEANLNFVVILDATSNSATMSTHTTSVTSNLNLHVHLGQINLSYGETRYTVTPYAYWAKNGALVVDYAVRPELAGSGFPPTWWQQRYGTNSNPTFILPWRYDPEKGFGISEEAKRYQTKDITLDPENPKTGDTLTITARVRNFSLIPTPIPVPVRFYVGDPDSGGQLITGIHGETSISTASIIPDRGRADVQIRWVVPGGLPPYPRIYATIDPDNSIAEIHEDDNKGFNVLGAQPITTGVVDAIVSIPGHFALDQNYPNPFNPSTNIRYELPASSRVSLKVYNLLGQVIARLVDRTEPSGEQSITWNANHFASGVYFYRLEATSLSNPSKTFTQVKKMVLLK